MKYSNFYSCSLIYRNCLFVTHELFSVRFSFSHITHTHTNTDTRNKQTSKQTNKHKFIQTGHAPGCGKVNGFYCHQLHQKHATHTHSYTRTHEHGHVHMCKTRTRTHGRTDTRTHGHTHVPRTKHNRLHKYRQ